MLFNLFPKNKKIDILITSAFVSLKKYSKENFEFKLDNEIVKLPYRIHYISNSLTSILSKNQKKILYCIYTRSHDGYTREKYIKKLVEEKIEKWEIPFIIKLCDDYVIQILEVIYESLKNRDNTDIKRFCLNNKKEIFKSYSRMVSYWNEYYRDIDFKDYVGRKIFVECLGYQKDFNK